MLLQSQKTSLRQIPTAHLAQTMTLLEMTNDELRQRIEFALSSNPALELIEDPRCPQCHRPLPSSGPCSSCSAPNPEMPDEPIVFLSPRQDLNQMGKGMSDDDMPAEEWTAAVEDLPTYVLKQIASELALDERGIAAHILTGLDDDGLLSVPLVEIAHYHHVPISKVAKVQRLIQFADPLGVGSRTPQEALMVQLEALSETRTVPPMAMKLIDEGLELLSRKAYTELSRKLHLSINVILKLEAFISDNLNPYPARAHWGEAQQRVEQIPTYREADVIISQANNEPNSPLLVEVVSPYAGLLRVNPLFRDALRQAPEERSREWEEVHEEAVLLVKCLQQRNNTLVRLMKNLASIQREFILYGDAYMKPITRAELSVILDVHKSTVSRGGRKSGTIAKQ